ncbi:MAG: gliding motility-associated ABC transporter substrate-binding protein GldG, partial [Bacteroidetes bacterium]
VATQPQKTLKSLSNYDAIIVAKPTEKFSEKEKYTLDQYICNGGKSLWLIDQIQVASDSLYAKGETLAYPVDLGLTDLLFSYGVRINHHLVTDKNSAKIPLSAGNLGGKTQYRFFEWKYLPLLTSEENHLINTNIAPSVVRYGNSIDTLKNKVVKKTVLLKSSSLSQAVGTPKILSLEEIKSQKPVDSSEKERFIGVLLEGKFPSAYQGRVPPFKYEKAESKETKMVVIADGDFIANDIKNGQPVALDTDKWSGRYYGNKEFLVNTMNYLLDDQGLVKIRSKKVKIPFLNKQKAFQETTYWQFVNIVLPLLLLGIFGVVYSFVRKWRYGRRRE